MLCHTSTISFTKSYLPNSNQACTISTGPPAFFSRRASDTQLLLARTGHTVYVRATQCHIINAGPNDNPACGLVSALSR